MADAGGEGRTPTDDHGRQARERVHAHMIAVARILPTDYADYGGTVERWADPRETDPDCSCGCRHAVWLDGDWLVCGRIGGPRQGMLTFEHQAGRGCFELAQPGDDGDHRGDVEMLDGFGPGDGGAP